MNEKLKEYLVARAEEAHLIPDARKTVLKPLVDFVLGQQQNNLPTKLNFICTHNSRRSHMAQLFCAAAAEHAELGKIECYSGGVEATRFNPNAINSLERAGFEINGDKKGENPVFFTMIGVANMLELFSKRFDDEVNPAGDFAAVMVCSDAEANCPNVPGAETRMSITYEDPKEFDGAPRQDEMYDTRSLQISREMMYVMNEVNKHV